MNFELVGTNKSILYGKLCEWQIYNYSIVSSNIVEIVTFKINCMWHSSNIAEDSKGMCTNDQGYIMYL